MAPDKAGADVAENGSMDDRGQDNRRDGQLGLTLRVRLARRWDTQVPIFIDASRGSIM